MGHHAFEAMERPQLGVTIKRDFLRQLLDAAMSVVARELICKLARLIKWGLA